jgi:hypothetical protein
MGRVRCEMASEPLESARRHVKGWELCAAKPPDRETLALSDALRALIDGCERLEERLGLLTQRVEGLEGRSEMIV